MAAPAARKPALTAPTRAAPTRPDSAAARGAPFSPCRVDTGGGPRDAAAPGCGPADARATNPFFRPGRPRGRGRRSGGRLRPRNELQHGAHTFGEPFEMRLKRRRERIEPMHPTHEIGERLSRRDVLDANRNHRHAAMHRVNDFVANLLGVIGVAGKDQDHHAAVIQRIDDRSAPVGARENVAWRNPAADLRILQRRAYRVSSRLIFAGVADESIEVHGSVKSEDPSTAGRAPIGADPKHYSARCV